MPRVSPSLSRPAIFVGLSTLLVAALVLSGCSSPQEAVKKSVAPTTTTVAVVNPAPFTATGIPADLAAVIKPLHFGGNVPSSPSISTVQLKREPVNTAGPVVVKGAVASWKGVPIAVVTNGKDVTLAVKASRRRIVGDWWPSLIVSGPSLGGVPRRVLL